MSHLEMDLPNEAGYVFASGKQFRQTEQRYVMNTSNTVGALFPILFVLALGLFGGQAPYL